MILASTATFWTDSVHKELGESLTGGTMDQRIIEFIAGLRAAGVRISIAESKDAFEAARHMGILSQQDFRDSLRATLVKEFQDQPVFDDLFALYFGNDEPPLLNMMEGLSPEEKDMLQQALRALLEQLRQQDPPQDQPGRSGRQQQKQPTSSQLDNLMQLLMAMLQGQNLSQETLGDRHPALRPALG
jgi:uncharacterized protein with von Willebrand factor type A (vWA) domain